MIFSSPRSSRHATRTARARGTRAVKPARLRQPSKNSAFSSPINLDGRIDDGVKRNGPALAFLQQGFRNILVIFLAVFDHRELPPESQLRRREAHARRFVHGRSHGFDQLLDFAAADFRNAQGAGALPQNGVSGLDDFKFHRTHKFCSQGNGMGRLMDFDSAYEDKREARRHKMKSKQSH